MPGRLFALFLAALLLMSACGSAGKSIVTNEPDAVAEIGRVFGVEEPLAQCIYDEFGNIVAAESETLTPELLTRRACGTTLFNLLNGVGASQEP